MRTGPWRSVIYTLVVLVAALPAAAQQRGGRGETAGGGGAQSPYQFDPSDTDPPPIVTHHSITVHGAQMAYTATVGRIPIPDGAGRTEGHMFYVAYTLDNPDTSHPRPVTFSYNGGPGSDSAYVHMGGFGPRRVALNDDGSVPPPPYKIVDNEETWLDASDLVFVDAIGTGYSRAVSMQALTDAAGVMGDLQCFSEFIRLWLYDNNRMDSPVILAGESYGTLRSAGLSSELLTHHVAVSGIVLLSSVLNMATLSPSLSDDRPYWLALPTLTGIAYYHHKLPPDMQSLTIDAAVAKAKVWALGPYQHYLEEGDQLQGAERQKALQEMASYTGLPVAFLNNFNLRINTALFSTELLRDEGEIIGRYDGGQVGVNRTPGSDTTDYDPSDLIEVPYLNQFVWYLKNELNYKTDLEYGDRAMGGAGIPAWNYSVTAGRGGGGGGGGRGGQGDVSGMLESAFARNPSMKLMLVSGYLDQATPQLEAEYSLRHLFITPAAQKNITIEHYDAGHMIYIRKGPREKLHNDFDDWVKTLSPEQAH